EHERRNGEALAPLGPVARRRRAVPARATPVARGRRISPGRWAVPARRRGPVTAARGWGEGTAARRRRVAASRLVRWCAHARPPCSIGRPNRPTPPRLLPPVAGAVPAARGPWRDHTLRGIRQLSPNAFARLRQG